MKASDAALPQHRSPDVHHEEIIVVGAGQVGLSMGYWLRQQLGWVSKDARRLAALLQTKERAHG